MKQAITGAGTGVTAFQLKAETGNISSGVARCSGVVQITATCMIRLPAPSIFSIRKRRIL